MTTPATASSLAEALTAEALIRARRRLLTAESNPTSSNTPTTATASTPATAPNPPIENEPPSSPDNSRNNKPSTTCAQDHVALVRG